jgi:hypothetical protein
MDIPKTSDSQSYCTRYYNPVSFKFVARSIQYFVLMTVNVDKKMNYVNL